MSKTSENFKVIGDVELVVTAPDGSVKDRVEVKNLVVSGGKTWIASRMASATDAVMSHMAIGTGTVTPSLGNTALVLENARVALSSTTASFNTVTFSAFFPAGTGTGQITEAGIFNAAALGTLLCRTTFDGVNKDVLDSLTINWTITII